MASEPARGVRLPPAVARTRAARRALEQWVARQAAAGLTPRALALLLEGAAARVLARRDA